MKESVCIKTSDFLRPPTSIMAFTNFMSYYWSAFTVQVTVKEKHTWLKIMIDTVIYILQLNRTINKATLEKGKDFSTEKPKQNYK